MSNWLGKLFGFGCRNSKVISQQAQKNKIVQEVAQKAERKIEPVAVKSSKSDVPSLGSKLSYGKWYYGVDTNAEPAIRRFTGGIEKKYPCKDGGELVITYVSRGDKSSRLDITKTGNPHDAEKGGWFRSFYSGMAVKHYKDGFGNNVTKVVKKKGARKQVLSTQNGKPTDVVLVPLKRWEISKNSLGNGKRIDTQVHQWNPKDFDRFCD